MIHFLTNKETTLQRSTEISPVTALQGLGLHIVLARGDKIQAKDKMTKECKRIQKNPEL